MSEVLWWLTSITLWNQADPLWLHWTCRQHSIRSTMMYYYSSCNTFGITGLALDWIRSYLHGHRSYVKCGGQVNQRHWYRILAYRRALPWAHSSSQCMLHHWWWSKHTASPLHRWHLSLYLCQQGGLTTGIQTINCCADALYNWLSHNGLALNLSKFEVIQFSVIQAWYTKNVTLITIASAPISLSPSIKSLGVIFDSNLTFNDHVAAECKVCYFHIRALRHIRASTPDNVANMMACRIVSSRLDYCNSFLAGMSETNFAKLQCVKNTLVCVGTGSWRYDHVKHEGIHITSVQARLQWLLVKARVTFKLETLVYNICETSLLQYLASILSNNKPIRSLLSSMKNQLEATAPRLKTSERAFCHAAAAIWNTLPPMVRECRTVGTYKNIWKPTCTTTLTKVPELLPPRLQMVNPQTSMVDISSTYLHTYYLEITSVQNSPVQQRLQKFQSCYPPRLQMVNPQI